MHVLQKSYDIQISLVKLHKKSMIKFNLNASSKKEKPGINLQTPPKTFTPKKIFIY